MVWSPALVSPSYQCACMPPRWQWLAGHSEGHAQVCDQVVLIVSLVHAAIDSRGAFPIQPSHTGSSHVQSDSAQCAGRSRTLGKVAGITDVLACTQFGPFTSAGSPLNAFSKLAGCCGTTAKPAGHPPISRELMSSVVPCPLSRSLPHPPSSPFISFLQLPGQSRVHQAGEC